MYCPSCGKSIPDGSRFCLHCGSQIPEGHVGTLSGETTAPPQQSGSECPICGRLDAAQKVESILNTGITNFNAWGVAGKATSQLSHYFTLFEMPKPATDAKIDRKRVLWRIMRYKRSLLFYCHRDNIVYIPGQNNIIQPSELQSFYMKDIEGKFCLIQRLSVTGWTSGSEYFVARIIDQGKEVIDIARIQCEKFWQLKKDVKDVKEHAILINQLVRDGWLVVEQGYVPEDMPGLRRTLESEWLFTRG